MWLLLDILYVLQSNFFLVRWNIVEKSSKDSFGYFVRIANYINMSKLVILDIL